MIIDDPMKEETVFKRPLDAAPADSKESPNLTAAGADNTSSTKLLGGTQGRDSSSTGNANLAPREDGSMPPPEVHGQKRQPRKLVKNRGPGT